MVLQCTDHLGYPTDLGRLATDFRPIFADIDNRELVEALKRLSPKYLTLCKYLTVNRLVLIIQLRSRMTKKFSIAVPDSVCGELQKRTRAPKS